MTERTHESALAERDRPAEIEVTPAMAAAGAAAMCDAADDLLGWVSSSSLERLATVAFEAMAPLRRRGGR